MNFFEGELRKLLGDSDVISDPSFAGREIGRAHV